MDSHATPSTCSFSTMDAIVRHLSNSPECEAVWRLLSGACFQFEEPVRSDQARIHDFDLRIEPVASAIGIDVPPASQVRLYVIGGGLQVSDTAEWSTYVKKGDHVDLSNRGAVCVMPVAGFGDCAMLCVSEGTPADLTAAKLPSAGSTEAPYYWGYDRRYAETYAVGGETWETTEPNEIVVKLAPRLITDRESQQIIDLGCGEGRDTLWLTRQGYRVTGVDVSSVALDRARRLATEMELSARFLERDVIFLRGITNNTYSVAFNMGCLHMLDDEDDRRGHLSRVFEVLEPGGFFVLNHCRDRWLKGFWSVVDYESVKDAVPGEKIPRRIRLADGSTELVEMEVLRHKVQSDEALSSELKGAGFEHIRLLSEDHFTFGNSAILIARKPWR